MGSSKQSGVGSGASGAGGEKRSARLSATPAGQAAPGARLAVSEPGDAASGGAGKSRLSTGRPRAQGTRGPAARAPEAALSPGAVGRLYPPPPKLDAALLVGAVQTSGSILQLLMPEHVLPAFAREPEPLEVFRGRLVEVRDTLSRVAEYGGELEMPAQQAQAHADWGLLAEACRSEQTYRTLVVQGLARGVLGQRVRLLEQEVEYRFEDRLLTLVEQRLVRERARQLGLSMADVRTAIDKVRRNLPPGDPPPEVEEQPLSRRAIDQAGTIIRTPDDLVDLAEHHLDGVLHQIREALKAERLELWLAAHDARTHPVWQAAERAGRAVAAATGAKELEDALELSAWEVLWGAGLPWIELTWKAGTANKSARAGTPADLVEQVERHGIRCLRNRTADGLLDAWLLSRPAAELDRSLVTAVRDASTELQRGRSRSARPGQKLWTVAWKAGLQWLDLSWEPGTAADRPPLAATRVRNVAELAAMIESGGVAVLESALRAGVLSEWLRCRPAVSGELLSAAEAAEQAASAGWSEGPAQVAAWEVAWAAGVEHLQLQGGAPGRPVLSARLTAIEDLGEALHRDGPDLLRTALPQGLLGAWLAGFAEPPRALLEAVHSATLAIATHGWGSPPATLACRILAWRAGAPSLPLKDGSSVSSLEDLLAHNPRSEPLKAAAAAGLLGAWLVERGLLPAADLEGCTRLVQLCMGGSDSDEGSGRHATLLSLALGWAVGRRELKLGSLTLSDPDVDALLSAATKSCAAFDDLGRVVREGSLALWLALRGGSTLTERANALTNLSGSGAPTNLLAQMTTWSLGDTALLVATDASSGQAPLRVETPAELVAYAATHWSVLDSEIGLPVVVWWLEQHTGVDLGNPAMLLTALALAGDTTLRHLDGRPIRLHEGATVGGWPGGKPAHASSEALKLVVDSVQSHPAPPAELEEAFMTGALLRWIELHRPDRLPDLLERMSAHAEPRACFNALLWGLGSTKLMVSEDLTVETPAELIAVARDHLPAIAALLDQGILAAWADADARTKLLALSKQVDDAAQRLKVHSESNRAGVFALAAAITVLDRGALAVVALGGHLDKWQAEPKQSIPANLPADEALTIPLTVRLNRRGDVPIHVGHVADFPRGEMSVSALPLNPEGDVRKQLAIQVPAPTEGEDGTSTAVQLRWPVLWPPGSTRSEKVELELNRAFPTKRFWSAVRFGLSLAVVPVAWASLFATTKSSGQGTNESTAARWKTDEVARGVRWSLGLLTIVATAFAVVGHRFGSLLITDAASAAAITLCMGLAIAFALRGFTGWSVASAAAALAALAPVLT